MLLSHTTRDRSSAGEMLMLTLIRNHLRRQIDSLLGRVRQFHGLFSVTREAPICLSLVLHPVLPDDYLSLKDRFSFFESLPVRIWFVLDEAVAVSDYYVA